MGIVNKHSPISVSDIRLFHSYSDRVKQALDLLDLNIVSKLHQALLTCWHTDKRVYLCGNGGSAGNAAHIANDFIYGTSADGIGLRAEALSANPSIMSCLANDIGYEHIFSHQLEIQGNNGDLLIALSGSGNSENIINALHKAKQRGMTTCAITGYCGGKAHGLAEISIHCPIHDMQISEDIQLMVAHMVTQALVNKAYHVQGA